MFDKSLRDAAVARYVAGGSSEKIAVEIGAKSAQTILTWVRKAGYPVRSTKR